ncbi:O-antigen ligase family protein [Candidatus Enterococcus mangumiae]|uniref:Polymerase n=1 Tax=Candidatus Enterococcus mangumiae TaxID=2230878 RepID=A0ABZ2SZI4_9ENTE|nr:O-antigen ligase family protein [Enterococcus sp. DIV1094]MBO0488943.1 O-antigen ligase family protein [Enterococcus sp. DIV1094]
MNIKNQRILTFFMWTVAIFPIIDVLNGLFLSIGVRFPIGVAYRLLFFLFLITMIVLGRITRSYYTYLTYGFIATTLALFLLQSAFLQYSWSWMIADLSVYVKYLLWILIPYFVYQRKELISQVRYDRLFIIISVLFTLGLLIPYLLGLGYQTYDNSDAGYKGYFFANNDTSFAFIVSITFTVQALIDSIKEQTHRRSLFLGGLFAGNFICLVLVGTKTGIFYGLVTLFYLLWRLVKGIKRQALMQQLFIWLFSFFGIFWLFIQGFPLMIQAVEGTYLRLVYFYHLFDGDLVRLISSSRSDFLIGGMSAFLEDEWRHFTMIFGQGFEYRLANFGRLGLIEMDFFDTLFGQGFLGTSLLLIMGAYFLYLAFQPSKRSVYSLALVVVFFYSFFAGHVLYSALSSTFLGLICGGIILTEKE